jgi:hypothetical protein
VENLLAAFLTGAVGAELRTRLTDLDELPAACRSHLRLAQDAGDPWIAWSTPLGPSAAWGQYDLPGSRRLMAYLLQIEWWDVPTGHHALWAYCNLKRTTEWTIGRGRHHD